MQRSFLCRVSLSFLRGFPGKRALFSGRREASLRLRVPLLLNIPNRSVTPATRLVCTWCVHRVYQPLGVQGGYLPTGYREEAYTGRYTTRVPYWAYTTRVPYWAYTTRYTQGVPHTGIPQGVPHTGVPQECTSQGVPHRGVPHRVYLTGVYLQRGPPSLLRKRESCRKRASQPP